MSNLLVDQRKRAFSVTSLKSVYPQNAKLLGFLESFGYTNTFQLFSGSLSKEPSDPPSSLA